MKHKNSKRTLGRNSKQRQQMLRGISRDLLEYGSVTTTKSKAQEVKRFIEPLITLAGKGELTLHVRRHLLTKLGRSQSGVAALLEAAKDYKERNGGYVRATKLPQHRSDGAQMVKIELVK